MNVEEKQALIEKLARAVVRRRMTTPAILFLESVKPLSFVGNQVLLALDPIIKIFATIEDYGQIAALLEDRENIETLILKIERMESEHE
ncbi:MAG: hypothetical protein V2A78_11205 [bacterium]